MSSSLGELLKLERELAEGDGVVRDDGGSWQLVVHQQTPVEEPG